MHLSAAYIPSKLIKNIKNSHGRKVIFIVDMADVCYPEDKIKIPAKNLPVC